MKRILIVLMVVTMTACTQFEVAEVDPATGYFKASKEAVIITSKKIDLDSYKSLLLIPDQDFVKGQFESIEYFDELITRDDLETEIIKNNLQEEIPSVRDKIGLNKAYKNYKEFLWFRYDARGTGNNEYGQFILTNPGTLEDIFVAEIKLDRIGVGVNDQYTWYPLFNSVIKYIEENSATYRK